ncbi:MAG: GNAT family N-acetyltransferase [Rhodobacteraceae bacterium]|nr:GNAT family N-acetyltransferase [Paracoccaceae bacterium]
MAAANTSGIVYSRDSAGVRDLLRHLRDSDDQFTPPLSHRVNLKAYADRLLAQAVRFEAWTTEGHTSRSDECHDRLIGLVAIYCNNPDRTDAFITSVSVESEFRGRGIAERLLQAALATATEAGFRSATLKVDIAATPARRLYARLAFSEAAQDGNTLTLRCSLDRQPG